MMMLLNAYLEWLFQEALKKMHDGVVINRKIINNLGCAHNTVLLTDTAEGIELPINSVVIVNEDYGMKHDSQKNQIMIISKD